MGKKNAIWDRMIDDANQKLRELFRLQRKEQLVAREGLILVVDDMDKQAEMLRAMLKMRGLDIKVENVPSLEEAKRFIGRVGPEAIKIVVVDIRLKNSKKPENQDGYMLIDWIRSEHPSLPYIVMTGMSHTVDDISHKVPGVDIFVKGVADIDEFADSMGLKPLDGETLLPTDARVEDAF